MNNFFFLFLRIFSRRNMQQQAAHTIKRRLLADNFSICPILNGLWQVSGGHGTIDYQRALDAVSLLINRNNYN